MDVIVTSKTLPVTAALRAMAERQATRLSKLGKTILKVWVSLEAVTRKKNDTQAMIVQYYVEVPGQVIVVKKSAADMYEALVNAASAASRRLRKFKERRLNRRRQNEWYTIRELQFTG